MHLMRGVLPGCFPGGSRGFPGCQTCTKTHYKTFAKPEELMQHTQGHGAQVIYKTSVEARDEKQSKQDSNASRSGIAEKREINDPNAHERPSKKTKRED